MEDDDVLLDVEAMCREIGGKDAPISAATLYRGIKKGRYPKPIAVSPKLRRWSQKQARAAIKALAGDVETA